MATLSLNSCTVLLSARSRYHSEPSKSDSRSFTLPARKWIQTKSQPERTWAVLSASSNSSLCSFRTRALTVESSQSTSPTPSAKEGKRAMTKYHFLVANAKFMLDEEEHFQEQLFERLRYCGEKNKEQDFWLVIEPKFLEKFPKITSRLKRPAVALVSTNATWITFMKLRLDRVLQEEYESESLEEVLASNPTEIKFDAPDKWVAPYSKYEYGWWKVFLPQTTSKSVN